MSDLDVVAVLTAKPGSEGPMREADRAGRADARGGRLPVQRPVRVQLEPTVFITIEKWRSQEDPDAHMQTEYIQSALVTARDHFAAAPAVHRLTGVIGGN